MESNKLVLRPWDYDYKGESSDKRFTLPPKTIYRYLSAERAIEAISKKMLWFSNPNNFNDPFDMYHGLIEYNLNFQRAKDFANRNQAHRPRKVRRELAFIASRKNKELIEFRINQFEETKAQSGVCCFSESSSVTLMWSHYADSHKGVVLGFNINPYIAVDGGLFFIQPVNYATTIKSMNIYDHQDKAMWHWVLTKSAIWSYEREVRAFCHNRNGLIDFDPKCLKEVVFGCNTSEGSKEKLLALLQNDWYGSVVKRKMIINPKTFDIALTDL